MLLALSLTLFKIQYGEIYSLAGVLSILTSVYLKSSMERFIDSFLLSAKLPLKHLKSSMERFIGFKKAIDEYINK